MDIHWLQAEFHGGASERANMIGQNIIMMAMKILCATSIPYYDIWKISSPTKRMTSFIHSLTFVSAATAALWA